MGKKIYVGNLPYSVTEQVLIDTFSQCGKVASVKLIMDKFTGRSKGYGFVEMSTDEEAAKAVTQFHGAECDGRTLVVNHAKSETDDAAKKGNLNFKLRPPRGGFGRSRF